MKKKTIIISVLVAITLLISLVAIYFIGSGFSKMTNVALHDYSVSEDGTEINQTFVTYVTITDGKSLTPEPEEIVVEEDAPVFTPKILVSSYSFSSSEIKQGDTVTAEVVFINTSKKDFIVFLNCL